MATKKRPDAFAASNLTILDAIAEPKVFGSVFRDTKTWQAWFAFLAALFGLPMTEAQRAIYNECTGRDDKPGRQRAAYLICGRRSGKSFTLSLVAVFLACFERDWRVFLGPGEIGTIMVIAQDRKQARTILRYVLGLLKMVPMLNKMIVSETQESVTLANRICIEVHSCSFRSVRGYTVIAALCDECAFWRQEDSANPDVEVLNAVEPSMVTIPDAMLLVASSPYARKGVIWDAFTRYYGKTEGPLVWRAPTRKMNPSVTQQFIDRKMEEDEASARAEYLAEFRVDIESYLSREVIDQCVERGCYERAYVSGNSYKAFVDPSGGSKDSFTLAISHLDKITKIGILDCVREIKPPFSPRQAVEDIARALKEYRLTTVTGDRYGGEFPRELFKEQQIRYEIAEQAKSDIYRELLSALNSGQVSLLDNRKLLTQLLGLERRTSRGTGRDVIDHAANAHDDIANAVCGSLLLVMKRGGYDITKLTGIPMEEGGEHRRHRRPEPEQEQPRTGTRPFGPTINWG